MGENEYKEMLGIEVESSTVTYKAPKKKRAVKVKEKVVNKVNEKTESENPIPENAEISPMEVIEDKVEENLIKIDSKPEVEEFTTSVTTSVKKKRKIGVIGIELAVIGVLALVILLTSAIMPKSGLATFFNDVFKVEKAELQDERVYSEFDIKSPYLGGQAVSENGVITFSENLQVYPMEDGVISSATLTDGKWDVTVSYNDNFVGVFSGLKYFYFNVGDKVYKTLPVGYSSENSSLCFLDGADKLLPCSISGAEGFSWL